MIPSMTLETNPMPWADFGIVESERAAKIAAFEKSSGDFYDVLEELDAWSEQLLKDDAEKIEEMRNDIQVGRNTSLFTIGTACLVFLGICLFVSFLIHKVSSCPFREWLRPLKRRSAKGNPSLSQFLHQDPLVGEIDQFREKVC